jgi:hypothetical protein
MTRSEQASKVLVENAKANRENIKFVIDIDGIGNAPGYPASRSVLLTHNTSIIQEIVGICVAHTNLTFQTAHGGGGSDFSVFATQDFMGMEFHETTSSGFVHSAQDVIGTINLEYCTEVAKAACAVLLKIDATF